MSENTWLQRSHSHVVSLLQRLTLCLSVIHQPRPTTAENKGVFVWLALGKYAGEDRNPVSSDGARGIIVK